MNRRTYFALHRAELVFQAILNVHHDILLRSSALEDKCNQDGSSIDEPDHFLVCTFNVGSTSSVASVFV